MTTTVCIRLMVTAALLVSPIAATAKTNPDSTAQLAQNSVAASTAQPKTTEPAAVPEKKICKQLASSYSHMSRRACLTPSEWKRVEAAAEQDQ